MTSPSTRAQTALGDPAARCSTGLPTPFPLPAHASAFLDRGDAGSAEPEGAAWTRARERDVLPTRHLGGFLAPTTRVRAEETVDSTTAGSSALAGTAVLGAVFLLGNLLMRDGPADSPAEPAAVR